MRAPLFGALHALRIDDAEARADRTAGARPRFGGEHVMNALKRAIPRPQPCKVLRSTLRSTAPICDHVGT
jgi:hypothetical protein